MELWGSEEAEYPVKEVCKQTAGGDKRSVRRSKKTAVRENDKDRINVLKNFGLEKQ